MSGEPRSDLGDLILAGIAELLEGQRRIERRIESIADDTDALDRYNRPYGDGRRLPRSPRRGQ